MLHWLADASQVQELNNGIVDEVDSVHDKDAADEDGVLVPFPGVSPTLTTSPTRSSGHRFVWIMPLTNHIQHVWLIKRDYS